MKYAIDRLEEDYIVIEDDNENTYNIPKQLIPNAKEGDVIKIEILKDETNKRKKEVEDLIDSLFID